jgi:hypothetical protein
MIFDNGELRLYAQFVMALLVPGRCPPVPDLYGIDPGSLDEWADEHLDLIIDEGRRELDAAAGALSELRSRGQVLFTVLLALIAFAVGGRVLGSVKGSAIFFAIWWIGIVVTSIGALGAAAVFAVTAQMGAVDTVRLSLESAAEVKRSIAIAYPKAVKQSKITNMARFTVLRDATWFAVLGTILVLGAWVGLKITG